MTRLKDSGFLLLLEINQKSQKTIRNGNTSTVLNLNICRKAATCGKSRVKGMPRCPAVGTQRFHSRGPRFSPGRGTKFLQVA